MATRPMHSILSSCFYSFTITIFLTLLSSPVHSETLESDIEALRSLKSSIHPYSISKSSYLYTWDFTMDPCNSLEGPFLGLICEIHSSNSKGRIVSIHLDEAGYDGFLTPAIGNLTALTVLNLRKNKLRGQLPDTISNLENVIKLSLSNNYFTGRLPTGIDRLNQLKVMDLSRNRLFGTIPPVIFQLQSLTHLRLSSNGFSGRILDLSGLQQLQALDLSDNKLYGEFQGLPSKLRRLSLSRNTLSGHISSLRKLIHLEELDLSDNKFSGSIGGEILTLPELIRVNVSLNHFHAIEVINSSSASRETCLQVLDAHANLLQGHLPVNLVTFENLQVIDLRHNLFSGYIPIQYGAKLESLWKRLYLDHNFLTGSLPPQLNSSAVKIRGSLAKNCLRCPKTIPLCHGGQRPTSECIGQNDSSD